MVDDDRSRPTSEVNELAASPVAHSPSGTPQTASFAVGALKLELSAAPGAARLVVAANGQLIK